MYLVALEMGGEFSRVPIYRCDGKIELGGCTRVRCYTYNELESEGRISVKALYRVTKDFSLLHIFLLLEITTFQIIKGGVSLNFLNVGLMTLTTKKIII